jgi:hypothetical protein
MCEDVYSASRFREELRGIVYVSSVNDDAEENSQPHYFFVVEKLIIAVQIIYN